MIQFSLEQYDVLQRYYELLGTVEEGFEYIVSSFEDIAYSSADQVFIKQMTIYFLYLKIKKRLLLLSITLMALLRKYQN